MAEVSRAAPEAVHEAVRSGRALLVCAYEDDAKCRKMQLQGAITLSEFKSRLSWLRKDQEIVFYCA